MFNIYIINLTDTLLTSNQKRAKVIQLENILSPNH